MIVIWWTNQKDCELLGERISNKIPAYIRILYVERRQRNARGKLWSNDNNDQHYKVKITWDDTELSNILSNHYSGIVMNSEDTETLFQYARTPNNKIGILTDTKLKIIDIDKMKSRVEEFERKFDSW